MNKKGFTLVELLAVIAILALLVILALPNILEMFNRAKKELFLTEAKTLYKEVAKKYITENMKGNKIDKVSNNKNKLNIESNGLKYDVKLDTKGNVKNFVVSNDTYCISGKFNNLSELTIDKVSEGPCSSDDLPVIAGILRNDFFEVSGLTERGLVHSITFYSDNRKIEGSKYYNVSKENNDSIKMYIKSNDDNSELYDLTIVGDGKIVFPENSSNLFSFYYNSCDKHSNPTKTNNTVENGNLVKNMNLINADAKIEKVAMACDIYSNLEEINFNNSIDTRNVTNMSGMFTNINTETLDLSDFDTSSVENMSGMFAGSKATMIKGLDNFDTRKVTSMSYMFEYSKITTLDLSSFDTSKVTNMSDMFYGSKATQLDLSNFDTRNVTNMSYMFSNSSLTSLNLSKFNTSKVTDMSHMFAYSQATTIDLSNFDTRNVTDMSGMFSGSKATVLDLSSFNTGKVTDMGSMFSSSKATILDLSNFDTSNVVSMYGMFQDSQATTLNLSNFNTSKVINMRYVFDGSNVTVLDLSGFDTSNVIDMSHMFQNTTNLKTIYASSKYNTSKVSSSRNMFDDCTSLVGGQGTAYNSTKVDKTYARIDGGSSNPGYFTLKQ